MTSVLVLYVVLEGTLTDIVLYRQIDLATVARVASVVVRSDVIFLRGKA